MNAASFKKNGSKKKEPIQVDGLMYGKIPPQSKNLEQIILAACMLEKGTYEIVSEILKPQCFYLDAHQRIFNAIQTLSSKSLPIDLPMVTEELLRTGELDDVGGPYYVIKLTNDLRSSAGIENHARKVLEKFMKREIIRISGESINDAYEDGSDVFEVIDDHEKKLTELTTGHLQSNYSDIEAVIVKQVGRIEELRNSSAEFTGVPSGFRDLDAKTYGWQDTDLIILAARPSVGKTAFALNLARNAALHPSKQTVTAFFSLEMSAGQLVNRILSSESGIWLEKISRGKLDDGEMKKLYRDGINSIIKSRIKIDDTPAINIMQLRAKARRMKRKYNLGLIIIDYLQLMSGTGDKNGNREQEISRISRDLKSLAKELVLPIIALSQLSRDVEKRKDGNKMPLLSDLRESGAIEQDADVVMFLYRPEYYDQNATEMGESTRGETHLRIAKHRNGDLANIKLRADLSIQKFFDTDDNEPVRNQRNTPVHGLPAGNWHPIESSESRDDREDPPF